MFCICKMRCYSIFCNTLHLISSDLDFRRKTKHPKHRSMDTLISIELWHSDIIFDLFDQGCIIFMDDSQHHITVTYGIGDHSIRKQIHHRTDICRFISIVKFFKHPIRTLDPSFDFKIFYPFFIKHSRQHLDSSLSIFFSLPEIFFEIRKDIIEGDFIQYFERAIF